MVDILSNGQWLSDIAVGAGTPYPELIVAGGGTVSDVTVRASPSPALIVDGGDASDVTVADGGGAVVSAGFVENLALTGSGASGVMDSGSLDGASVTGSGASLVLSGGIATGALVGASGGGAGAPWSIVTSGRALVSSATIVGYAEIASGQVRDASFVAGPSGGEINLLGNGVISSATIGSGETLLEQNGNASGITIKAGGILELGGKNGAYQYPTLEVGGGIDVDVLSYRDNFTAGIVNDDVGFQGISIEQRGIVYEEIRLTGHDYFGDRVAVSSDGHGGTLVTLEDGVPCYCPGTLIATPDGERRVEDLVIGDLVSTLSNGARAIRWIGRRFYSGRFAAGNPDVLPVLFRAGALSDGVPHSDLRVSPLHAMLIDGVLIPAVALVNGMSILQEATGEDVAYLHVELDRHDILRANGAAAESFVDDDSRGMFHNAAEHARLYPETRRLLPRYCAPRVESGEAVEAARQRLRARGFTLGRDVRRAPIRGYVDRIGDGGIGGWAFDPDRPDAPVMLDIWDGPRLLGTITADRPRPDLPAIGAAPVSRCGFDWSVPPSWPPMTVRVIELRCARTGAVFAGALCRADTGAGPRAA